jgi:hypothetical protein
MLGLSPKRELSLAAAAVVATSPAASLRGALLDVWKDMSLPAAEATASIAAKPEEEFSYAKLVMPPPEQVVLGAVQNGLEQAGKAIDRRTGKEESPSTKDRNYWDSVAAQELLDARGSITGNVGQPASQSSPEFDAFSVSKKDKIVIEYLNEALDEVLQARMSSAPRENTIFAVGTHEWHNQEPIAYLNGQPIRGLVDDTNGRFVVLNGQIGETNVRGFEIPRKFLRDAA